MPKARVLSDKPVKTGRKWEYREVVLATPGWQIDVVYSFGPNASSENGKTTLVLRRPIPGKVATAYGMPVRAVNPDKTVIPAAPKPPSLP